MRGHSPVALLNPPGHTGSLTLAVNIKRRLEDRSGSALPVQLEQLIRRMSRGDTTAFEMLYRQIAPKLFGIALRIAGQREEAEGITRELYCRLAAGRRVRHRHDHGASARRPVDPGLQLALDLVSQITAFWVQAIPGEL